jgi:hypothetical protein
MREPTEGNGPRGTIRISETLARFDGESMLAVNQKWLASSVEELQPAQQNGETKPAHVPELVVGVREPTAAGMAGQVAAGAASRDGRGLWPGLGWGARPLGRADHGGATTSSGT